MKEVIYEDWQKNPTPRMMWVWNATVEDKVQAKVIFVAKADTCIYPVLSIMKDDVGYDTFQHCAEIEKQRRMTNKELAWWLSEKPHRELKMCDYIYHDYDYKENEQYAEVTDFLLIREDNGEWREPFVEAGE